MNFILLLILSLSSSGAFAAFNEVLSLKQVSEDGNQFVFMRKEGPAPWNGITIKDPQTKVTLYEARIIKCSSTSCLGNVIINHSGIKLRLDEEYLHSYNETPINFESKDAALIKIAEPVAEAKPEPAPVKTKKTAKAEVSKPPVEKKVVAGKATIWGNAIYGSYGSPIGPGVKVGYFRTSESLWYGLNYGSIASTANQVNMKGMLVSGVLNYSVFKPSPSIDVSIFGELGFAKATFDFTEVNSDGPIEDDASYFVAGGGEGKLTFNPISLVIRGGISKAGFSGSYVTTIGEFNNPYSKILMFVEIGAYYNF